jgi:elongation factor G
MGSKVIESEIPAEFLAEATKHRATLVEAAASQDDDMMNTYLEGGEFTIEQLKAAIRKGTLANKLFPVFTGTALKNKGVQLILDAVVEFLPSPLDIPPVKGTNPETGEEMTREASDTPRIFRYYRSWIIYL